MSVQNHLPSLSLLTQLHGAPTDGAPGRKAEVPPAPAEPKAGGVVLVRRDDNPVDVQEAWAKFVAEEEAVPLGIRQKLSRPFGGTLNAFGDYRVALEALYQSWSDWAMDYQGPMGYIIPSTEEDLKAELEEYYARLKGLYRIAVVQTAQRDLNPDLAPMHDAAKAFIDAMAAHWSKFAFVASKVQPPKKPGDTSRERRRIFGRVSIPPKPQ